MASPGMDSKVWMGQSLHSVRTHGRTDGRILLSRMGTALRMPDEARQCRRSGDLQSLAPRDGRADQIYRRPRCESG
jgi:hypothetical protein